MQIGLCCENERRYFLVHRLVLSTFYPIYNTEQYEVNHKDENKTNNNLENLEWMTPKENRNYGTRNERLSKTQGLKVKCVEKDIVYDSFHDASKINSIDVSGICMCCTGYRNRKTAGGYHWEYVK